MRVPQVWVWVSPQKILVPQIQAQQTWIQKVLILNHWSPQIWAPVIWIPQQMRRCL